VNVICFVSSTTKYNLLLIMGTLAYS